jgi:hypothetical protein
MEGSCEYNEYAVADRRQVVVLLIGCWAGGSHLVTVKKMLRNATQGPRLGRILWNNLNNKKLSLDLAPPHIIRMIKSKSIELGGACRENREGEK